MALKHLQDELKQRGLFQEDVALKMNIDRSELSRFLTGRRPAPVGFEADFRKAMDLVASEAAARILGVPAGAAR